MNTSAAKSGGWSGSRFLTVVTVLFATQAGLVLLFAERAHPSAASPVVHTVFRRLGGVLDESALSKYIFASDPTIFPSSSSHGFADQAWLRLSPVEYNKTTNDSEAPSFLEFATNPLRGSAQPPGPAGDRIPFDLTGEPAISKEPVPTYAPVDGSRPASFVRIDGALASRRIDGLNGLREWPSSVVLSNTVVRFGVSRSGEVVSAGLWSGSGSTDADASAVDTVNTMRFTPGPGSPGDLTWDRATFYWRTVAPPPGTNAPGTPQFP